MPGARDASPGGKTLQDATCVRFLLAFLLGTGLAQGLGGTTPVKLSGSNLGRAREESSSHYILLTSWSPLQHVGQFSQRSVQYPVKNRCIRLSLILFICFLQQIFVDGYHDEGIALGRHVDTSESRRDRVPAFTELTFYLEKQTTGRHPSEHTVLIVTGKGRGQLGEGGAVSYRRSGETSPIGGKRRRGAGHYGERLPCYRQWRVPGERGWHHKGVRRTGCAGSHRSLSALWLLLWAG